MVTTVHIIILTWRSLWQPAQNNSAGRVTERRRERGERVKRATGWNRKKRNWDEKKKKKKETPRAETGSYTRRGPFEEAKDRHFHFRGERRVVADCWWVPGPVGLKEGWVVDDEGQEHRKRPQKKGWEKLGNDWALELDSKMWLISDTKEG